MDILQVWRTVKRIHQNGYECIDFKQLSVTFALLLNQMHRFIQTWKKSDTDWAQFKDHSDAIQHIHLSSVYNLSLSLVFCDVTYLHVFFFTGSSLLHELRHHDAPSPWLERAKENKLQVLQVFNIFNAILCEYNHF